MRKPIIAGNWKMNKTIAEASQLVHKIVSASSQIENVEIVLCPPYTALYSVSRDIQKTNIALGAQNMFWELKGAYTGEISPNILLDIKCKYVIIGHSERRQYFFETDDTVNKKVKSALENGLTPIICVGESLEEREAEKTFSVIERQIQKGLSGIEKKLSKDLVIAYEPIWAIGTGRNASPEQAQEVHIYIRDLLKKQFGKEKAETIRIQYGGSVKPDNVSQLMSQGDIDGALVGGASLDPESFMKIITY